MKRIPIGKKKLYFAVVDDEDFDRLAQFRWGLIRAKNGRLYASRTTDRRYLHREIMNVNDPAIDVDHQNRDGLDCQKLNLRLCSRSQNSANAVKTQRHTTSRFKGVSWFRPAKRWRAYIGTRENRKWLGYFESETDAAKAYDEAAIERYGEFARVNFS